MSSRPEDISVIVPAYNEEKYVPATLNSIFRARDLLVKKAGRSAEILLVDNDSADQTVRIASALGARVVHESEHNIGKVRNTGAKSACGETFVFVDADTIVPETLLWRIHQVMSDPASLGGAVDTDYRPARLLLKVYLRLWRRLGQALHMAQGAAQFYRRDIFFMLGGFDERLFMGEDVELFWRLKRMARQMHKRVSVIADIQVIPSCRRFDHWPFWRTLVWTNPLLVAMYRRRAGIWRGWYQEPPR